MGFLKAHTIYRVMKFICPELGGTDASLASSLEVFCTMGSGAATRQETRFFFSAGIPVVKENIPSPPSLVMAWKAPNGVSLGIWSALLVNFRVIRSRDFKVLTEGSAKIAWWKILGSTQVFRAHSLCWGFNGADLKQSNKPRSFP